MAEKTQISDPDAITVDSFETMPSVDEFKALSADLQSKLKADQLSAGLFQMNNSAALFKIIAIRFNYSKGHKNLSNRYALCLRKKRKAFFCIPLGYYERITIAQ